MSLENQLFGHVPYVPHNISRTPGNRSLVSKRPFIRTFTTSENPRYLERKRLISKLQVGKIPALKPEGGSRIIQSHNARGRFGNNIFMPIIYGSKQNIYIGGSTVKTACAERPQTAPYGRRRQGTTTSIGHLSNYKNQATGFHTKSVSAERFPVKVGKTGDDEETGYVNEYTEEAELDIFSDIGCESIDLDTISSASADSSSRTDEMLMAKPSVQRTSLNHEDAKGNHEVVAFEGDVCDSSSNCSDSNSECNSLDHQTEGWGNNNSYNKTTKTRKLSSVEYHFQDLVVETNKLRNGIRTPICPKPTSNCSKVDNRDCHKGGKWQSRCSCEERSCSAIPLVVVKMRDELEEQSIKDHQQKDDSSGNTHNGPATEQVISAVSASAYDIDNEHTEIMKKALNVYHEHTDRHTPPQDRGHRAARPRSAVVPAASQHRPQSRVVSSRPGSAKTTTDSRMKPRGKVTAVYSHTKPMASTYRPKTGHTNQAPAYVRPNSSMDNTEDMKIRPNNGQSFIEVNMKMSTEQIIPEDASLQVNDDHVLLGAKVSSLKTTQKPASRLMNGRPSSAHSTPPKMDARYTGRNMTSVRSRPFSAVHTSVVHPRPDSPNARLSVIMPTTSSIQAKQVYMKAHRPHSEHMKRQRHGSFPKPVDPQPSDAGNETGSVDESSPSHPYHSLHSPRVRTVSYSDNCGMNIDSDVISVVGMANNMAVERPAKEMPKVHKPQKADVSQTSNHRPGSRDPQDRAKKNYGGTCFASARNVKKPFFTINPEWVSESLSVKGVSFQSKKNYGRTSSPSPYMEHRRCKSAPPLRSRNPITWENW